MRSVFTILVLTMLVLPAVAADDHAATEAGSWLLLKPLGAVVQLNADPEKILEKQFNTGSVEMRNDSYIVTVKGTIFAGLVDQMGYKGSKIVQGDYTTRITILSSPESVVKDYLSSTLGANVKVVGFAPIQYEIGTNVTRESLNAILAQLGGSVATGRQAFVEGLTVETINDTKKILYQRMNRMGLQGTKVWLVGNKVILVFLPGVDVATAQDVVGKPGKFEIRIQTNDNETEHVLYGDAVKSVDIPSNNGDMWGVPFTLSDDAAKILQKATIDSGAINNPQAHVLSVYLDKDQIFSAPLSPELAASLQKVPSRSMVAEVGAEIAGSYKAKLLYIYLTAGALPVDIKVIWAE